LVLAVDIKDVLTSLWGPTRASGCSSSPEATTAAAKTGAAIIATVFSVATVSTVLSFKEVTPAHERGTCGYDFGLAAVNVRLSVPIHDLIVELPERGSYHPIEGFRQAA